MWLKNLQVNHFRNYHHQKVNFSSGLNIFLGENAQGKTNILEAIYFLALTRSHRTRSDRDLIHFSKTDLSVSGQLIRQSGKLDLSVNLSDKGRVTKVNQLKQNKLSAYIGHMNIVLFAPEDLQLIKGAPALRRKFIDMELGQIKPGYLSQLSDYNHILRQRNSYLKQTDKVDMDFLAVLDEQLVEAGSKVIQHRLKFVEELEKFGQSKHWDISNQYEELQLTYSPSFAIKKEKTIAETFKVALQQSHKRDLFKKNTGVGPHRDDLHFFINGMEAKFGSQGQHRSLVLSLKLAEIELIKSLTQEAPILLLDDVMSELDNKRQLKLLETISERVQTFITTTTLEHLPHLPKELDIFLIESGTIQKAEPRKN